MDFVIDLLIFILGLSLLIMVHELGHFLCAKAFNVYCHEFSIGMGPAIYSTQKGETKYSIRALPIGGYVSMAGEGVDEATNIKETPDEAIVDNLDGENKTEGDETPDVPYERTINGIAAWKRFIVISAGVIMNFIFSFIFLFIFILCNGVSVPDTSKVILVVEKDSLADKAEIKNEIRINGINIQILAPEGNKILDYQMQDVNDPETVISLIDNSYQDINKLEEKLETVNQCISFRYLEEDKNKISPTVCRPYTLKTDSEGVKKYTTEQNIGISVGYYSKFVKVGVGEALVEAGKLEWELGTLIFKSLGTLFTKEGFENVSGVVGIFSVSKQFASMGFGYYMYFLGFISVNLGVMNLLPIPGLDGSQLLVIGIEGVTRKKINNRVKSIINMIGLIFLLGLMGIIMIKDIIKLF